MRRHYSRSSGQCQGILLQGKKVMPEGVWSAIPYAFGFSYGNRIELRRTISKRFWYGLDEFVTEPALGDEHFGLAWVVF